LPRFCLASASAALGLASWVSGSTRHWAYDSDLSQIGTFCQAASRIQRIHRALDNALPSGLQKGGNLMQKRCENRPSWEVTK
jgi:hypothetical protein